MLTAIKASTQRMLLQFFCFGQQQPVII